MSESIVNQIILDWWNSLGCSHAMIQSFGSLRLHWPSSHQRVQDCLAAWMTWAYVKAQMQPDLAQPRFKPWQRGSASRDVQPMEL